MKQNPEPGDAPGRARSGERLGAHRGSAVITGASSGVGHALAVALAPSMERVMLVGRDSARLDAVAREVEARGARAECFSADFRECHAQGALARELAEKLPELSVLVHSAGLFVSGSVEATSVEELELLMNVNLRAPYLLSRELLPALAAGGGDVVFINSSAVGQRRAGLAVYGATKHALLGLADSLRQEVNPAGVRVLSVFLGATATAMQEQIYAKGGREYQPELLLSPADVARIVCDVIALPRGAEVTDLHLRPATAHRTS
jgi:short-subunit dehydrogenase